MYRSEKHASLFSQSLKRSMKVSKCWNNFRKNCFFKFLKRQRGKKETQSKRLKEQGEG
jgi:hypothetical protein